MRSARSWRTLLLATAVGSLLHCAEEPAARPNLLLITLEDVRPDDLACYDPRVEQGYAICDLAEEGGRFVWAFSTSPATGPAAASLLTGRSPSEHGVSETVASFLPDPESTLAERLRQEGYTTAAFVSNPELNRSRNLNQGFDVYRDRVDLGSVVEATRNWTESAQPPWFIWVHLMRWEDGGEIPLSESNTLRLDRSVAELITRLEDETRAQGILLTSLHGRNDDVTAKDPWLDLTQLRVPLLWQAPKTTPGPGIARKLRTPVSLVDVAPTLLDAAGVDLSKTGDLEGLALPYADLPARPLRTLWAEDRDSTLLIHGVEFARFASDPEVMRDGVAGSGRLWPADDPASEKTPTLDTRPTGRDRHRRLGAQVGLPATQSEPNTPRQAPDGGFVQP